MANYSPTLAPLSMQWGHVLQSTSRQVPSNIVQAVPSTSSTSNLFLGRGSPRKAKTATDEAYQVPSFHRPCLVPYAIRHSIDQTCVFFWFRGPHSHFHALPPCHVEWMWMLKWPASPAFTSIGFAGAIYSAWYWLMKKTLVPNKLWVHRR